MKKIFLWIAGILAACALIVTATILIDIRQYGDGKVHLWQVMAVNLRHNTLLLEKHGQKELFLTDHDWTGDEVLKRGCKEVDRMGSMGFYVTPDGTKFTVLDTDEWCPWFRLHRIEGISLKQLGLGS
jgi:hypothetical protein